MHTSSLPKATWDVYQQIENLSFLQNFYLAGGTALALQLGHRQSVDLDFFTSEKFNPEKIKRVFRELGNFSVIYEDADTLDIFFHDVKVSFFYYPYPVLYPFFEEKNFRLADIRDIGAMKIDAISSRGSKKDFVDLYILLRKYSLDELIIFYQKKYEGSNYSLLHIYKSFCYFADAESAPLPVMHEDLSWDEIKSFIQKKVKQCL